MILQNLKNKKLILASKSPRRQALLEGLDLSFEIRLKEVEEIYPPDLALKDIPSYLSELKAAAFQKDLKQDEILITADTIVILGNQILEKPKSIDEARKMLTALSGQTHTVVTGVCIQSPHKKEVFSEQTSVTFGTMTNEEIDYYIETYQPFDKAGSYGAQEWLGYVAISELNGSYFNVMGLPIHRVYQELKKF